MFKMYNTDLITNITEEVTEYKRGNWINMIAPSDDEIKTVCENINIQEDFIRYALDPEERARIDYEEDDGTTLIKTVTASGVVSETIHRLPEITSTVQRNEVIKDLCKQKINQETIAAMLDISQSTVSNVLRKK